MEPLKENQGYKFLTGYTGSYGHGNYRDYMPHGKRPGKWLPKKTPWMCKSGYHYCADEWQLIEHIGESLYVVEVRGRLLHIDSKSSAEQTRLLRKIETWNPYTQRLFSVDCARKGAHLTTNPELINACLDIAVAYAEYGKEWAAARDAAWAATAALAWTAAKAETVAAAAARAADSAMTGNEARWVVSYASISVTLCWGSGKSVGALSLQVAEGMRSLLKRYLNGEQGPFVESEEE